MINDKQADLGKINKEKNKINIAEKKNEVNKQLDPNDKTNQFDANNVNLKKYEKKFNEKNFWEKIKKFGINIGAKPIYIALSLYYALPKVTLIDKAIIIGALGYLISPFDLIPDYIPGAGFIDDIAVLYLVFYRIKNKVDDEVKNKAKNKFKSIFDKYNEKEIEELLN